jgi:flagellar basal-body rod protein FlgB
MVGKLDQMLHFQETALSLRAQRQQLLASNIANADTPNYKARDIDFNKALEGALTRSTSGAASPNDLAKTATAHLASNVSQTIGGAPLLYSNPEQGNIDGNTVDMDVQRNQFTDNAMRYEVDLTLASAKIKAMLTAIQGQ